MLSSNGRKNVKCSKAEEKNSSTAFSCRKRGIKGDFGFVGCRGARLAARLAACCALMALLIPSVAYAHNVNVFAYVEGDTIVTESYFNDGGKCRDSIIDVFDPAGNKLVEGKTDEQGMFSFPIPAATDLLIRLTASMGHQAEYTIPASDLPAGIAGGKPLAVPDTSEAPVSLPEKTSPAAELGGQSGSAAVQTPVPLSEIEQAVDRAVARQLQPIRRALEESKRKQRFSDIVGGIGYIVGLMGLVLYFRSRQRKG